MRFHRAVRKMYNWHNVAERTEHVYDRMISTPPVPLIERFRRFGRDEMGFAAVTCAWLRYYGCGVIAGKLFVLLMALDFLLYTLLEWLFPRENIGSLVDLLSSTHRSCLIRAFVWL